MVGILPFKSQQPVWSPGVMASLLGVGMSAYDWRTFCDAALRTVPYVHCVVARSSGPPAPKKPRLHSDSQMPPTPAAVDAAATGGPDPAMSLQPAAAASSPPQEFSLLLTNCRVLDVAAGNYLEGLQSVLLQGGLIREVRPMGHAGATTTVMVAAAESADAESADAESADAKSADAESADAESADAESADAESADAESADAESADAESADAEAEAGIAPIEGFRTHPPTAVEVDCGGAVLMPGLCDAHVHCTAVTANLAGLMSLPESYVSTKAAHILAGMLARGFTTVRDAGGADFGLAQAVEEGLVLGPRILFTGPPSPPDVAPQGLRSLSIADKAKVPMCFGSDLLGNMHPAQVRHRTAPLRYGTISGVS
ncbi:hypothetical protein VOLCADRAFT_97224 [Volvox carteri f. nagariensis]|uniref:Amidohydrolase-related domain-containing protein n=1 Tax=Volvox carteri f. nagariensis TaxID=3068 RepID=D8UC69_VOLCA|nr:uncharacterized protein VOLCADRAFT_97224 [Volvox carteri f. nagariensis]EFJ42642.1 hypothetical protein VOLCADRAFT_97224 [Volvox carteri f. nagariensis]|eukprot:XP_002956293.1 hypothetical protein VOLCADRAFT_97224 [Volvox carteri f. nagariensis]